MITRPPPTRPKPRPVNTAAKKVQAAAVIFKPVNPKGPGLRCKLGNGLIIPTVAGGWQTVQRNRRKSLTDYVGADPVSMDLPILFDEYEADKSVESDVAKLYRMMLAVVGDLEQPAVIELLDFPVPFRSEHFVINNITPGDEIRRQSDGHRVQAQFTVTVMEYVPGTIVGQKPPKHSPAKRHIGQTANDKVNTYTTKTGDTLKKIAVHFYGEAKGWQVIADANNLRDPHYIKSGTKLKIPAHD